MATTALWWTTLVQPWWWSPPPPLGPSTLAHAAAPESHDNAPPPTTTTERLPATVTLPLELVPALGGAYVVHFTLFREPFGAILDTGSPFLTVPFRCNKFAYKYRWGCYRPERTTDSGYANTVEAFDNNQGTVVWRKAAFSFDNSDDDDTTNRQSMTQEVVFGVFGEALMDGPGGVFFGLIKDTDKWIRPSFMGQTGYTSFSVDLRRDPEQNLEPKLVLSSTPLIGSLDDNDDDEDYIPLVRDLNRKYKAPVVHYTACACSLTFNGVPQELGNSRRPTYIIFDTGVTGMVISQKLFDERYRQARQNREKSLWGTVQVGFRTKRGNIVELSAIKPVTTPLGDSFAGYKGNVIVLGLAFLDGRVMTIDTQGDRIQFCNC
eukprot:scaffold7159_cov149-Amphora_coffeaeformis.AAC.1